MVITHNGPDFGCNWSAASMAALQLLSIPFSISHHHMLEETFRRSSGDVMKEETFSRACSGKKKPQKLTP